jgi:hypothetical protein
MGVYVLILEKPGCEYRVYIGSSVEVAYGLRARICTHRKGNQPPYHINESKRDGYTLVHTAILVCMAMPTPPDRPVFRAITTILEAAFSYMFWAM